MRHLCGQHQVAFVCRGQSCLTLLDLIAQAIDRVLLPDVTQTADGDARAHDQRFGHGTEPQRLTFTISLHHLNLSRGSASLNRPPGGFPTPLNIVNLKLQSFSATRNFALRARGLLRTSTSSAVTGFRVTIRNTSFRPHAHPGRSVGQVQPVLFSTKNCFTMRSSREWKEMTAIRPPDFKNCVAVSRPRLRLPSSSFTAMRNAWKTRVAG